MPASSGWRWLRPHAGIAGLLTAGLLVRVGVLVAYPQAFWFPDSTRYLDYARGWRLDALRQGGYSLLLKALIPTGTLYSVSVAQHVAGLAVALGLYALLVRLGLPRWLGCLAVAPVVLDAYQLTVEHYVLSDPLFLTLLVAGLVTLVWPGPLTPARAGVAGLLLAASATVRVVSLPLALATLGYVLVRRAGRRALVAYALAVAVVLGGYASWFTVSNGSFGFSTYGPAFLYGRVAPFADCARLRLSEPERRLCPPEPVGQRPTHPDFYVWDERSPAHGADLATQRSFVAKVVLAQPLDAAGAVLVQTLHYFVPYHRSPDEACAAGAMLLPADPPGSATYTWCVPNPRQAFAAEADPATLPRASPLSHALGRYAQVVQTPRALLLASLLLVAAAAVWRPRRRLTGPSTADIVLLGGWGVGLVVVASVATQMDERYALPAAALLPPAGALAAYRLWRLARSTAEAPDASHRSMPAR